MPFDLVAWYESQDASAGLLVSAVNTGEDQYAIKDDDLFVKQEAPWLAGILALAVSTPKYCEVRQPSLKIPYRFSRAELLASSTYQDGYYHMWDRPLPLYSEEKMNIYVINATNEVSMIVAWLASAKATRSQVEQVNPTHVIRAESDTALVADAWTNIAPLTWSHDLPKGRYAIVGMNGCTQLAATGHMLAACRLVIPGVSWRPGIILNRTETDKAVHTQCRYSFEAGNLWPLMPEISFAHNNLPTAQALSNAVNDNHMFELLLQKIG